MAVADLLGVLGRHLSPLLVQVGTVDPGGGVGGMQEGPGAGLLDRRPEDDGKPGYRDVLIMAFTAM
ncbi:hypothetical protein [Streptomyces sp. NPDC056463]|uniref:hypothetical protein n=1 Tax=Streptomyces sp. NPDC056463 TaxID=3345827 RepID=UPI00368C5EA5